ncbi:hypothetical protein K435DRAFT_839194 [Dendrothele bispora CBS 962.96]|uniref:Uncharacterized protein n=1 Tax=Dendrothele bispora (strain CBS 962.96) TaxID=1314807 RepID=A0A4S8M1X5_DENBC|nr:hypothetical protein K435DRAFT_839194 [Dendrothele bispora CBS 962.96]
MSAYTMILRTFKSSPTSFILFPFNFLISRMYIVALLVTLNLQTSSKETTNDFAMSISHVHFKRAQNSTIGAINDSRPAPKVLVTVERHDDGYHSLVKQVKLLSTVDGTDKKCRIRVKKILKFNQELYSASLPFFLQYRLLLLF